MATVRAASTNVLHLSPAMIVAGGLGAAALPAVLSGNLLLGAAVAVAIIAAFAFYRWPEAAIPAILFLLYLNVPVVAVKFHHVPRVLGMLSPLPLLAPLAYYTLVRREQVVLTATLPWILAFLCVQIAGAFFARDPDVALDSLKIAIIEGLGLYLVVTNVVRREHTLRWTLWALILAGGVMGSLSLFQYVTKTYSNNYGGFAQISEGRGLAVETAHGTEYRARLSGPIGEKNRYAQIMLMLVPLAVYCFQSSQSRRAKVISGGCLFSIAMGAALTYSRGGAVACVLVLLLTVALRYIQWRHVVMVGLAGLLLVTMQPEFQKRALSTLNVVNVLRRRGPESQSADGAVRGRATAMLAAARVYADYPLIGVGPGMFNYYVQSYSRRGGLRAFDTNREAHCLYLEIAAEQGTLGLFAFGAAVATSLIWLFRLRWSTPFASDVHRQATAFILALSFYLATGLFLHFSYARYFWIILALADASARIGFQALSQRTPQVDSPEPASARLGSALT